MFKILSLINVVFIYLTIKNNKKMAEKLDVILDLLAGINDSTNNIAADLERLAGGLEGGLTAEEAEIAIAELTVAAERLRAVAAVNPEPADPVDPTDPV